MLGGEERAPEFFRKERFLDGLFPSLREKFKGKFPTNFTEPTHMTREKERKLRYQDQVIMGESNKEGKQPMVTE